MSGAQVRSLTLGEGETAATQRESGSNVFCTAVFALLFQPAIPLLTVFHKGGEAASLRICRGVASREFKYVGIIRWNGCCSGSWFLRCQ